MKSMHHDNYQDRTPRATAAWPRQYIVEAPGALVGLSEIPTPNTPTHPHTATQPHTQPRAGQTARQAVSSDTAMWESNSPGQAKARGKKTLKT